MRRGGVVGGRRRGGWRVGREEGEREAVVTYWRWSTVLSMILYEGYSDPLQASEKKPRHDEPFGRILCCLSVQDNQDNCKPLLDPEAERRYGYYG
jgi:hypothetical protein